MTNLKLSTYLNKYKLHRHNFYVGAYQNYFSSSKMYFFTQQLHFTLTGGVPNLGQCLKLGHLSLCIELTQILMKTFLFQKCMSDSVTNYNYVGDTKISISIKKTNANKCTLSEIFLTEISKSFSAF